MMVATSTTPSVTERYSFAIPFWAASAISTTTSRSVTPSAPDWRFQDHAQKDEQGDVHDRAAHDHLGDGMRRHDQLPPADVEQHGAHRSTSSRVTAHVPAPSAPDWRFQDHAQKDVTELLVVVLIADAAQKGMAKEYRSVTEGVVLVAT